MLFDLPFGKVKKREALTFMLYYSVIGLQSLIDPSYDRIIQAQE